MLWLFGNSDPARHSVDGKTKVKLLENMELSLLK